MNAIEIIETVKVALLKQNSKSRGHKEGGLTTCMYRGADGMKCAVGHLIKDEHYAPKMEGNAYYEYSVTRALIASGIDVKSNAIWPIIYDLQALHDHHEPKEWPERFKLLEAKYGKV